MLSAGTVGIRLFVPGPWGRQKLKDFEKRVAEAGPEGDDGKDRGAGPSLHCHCLPALNVTVVGYGSTGIVVS